MTYKKHLLTVVVVIFIGGCAASKNIFQPNDCPQIGCADGLQFYPHEEFSAVFQHRRFYGINGELPSDYPAGSLMREQLRQQQIEKLRSMGLDAHGRPLYE